MALVAVVVIGGGVYLLTQGDSAVPSGDALLTEMYAEASTVNSASYTGSVDVSGMEGGEEGSFHADFTGASMTSATASSSAKLSVNANATSGAGEAKMSFAGSLELIGLDREAYVKVTIGEETLAQVPFAAMINNRWIRISVDELAEAGLIPPDALEQLNNSANKENVAKLKEIMLSHKVLEATSIEDGESIGGEDTYRVTLAINEDELLAAMNDWAAYLKQPQIGVDEAAEMKVAAQKFEQYAQISMWVGQDSKLPRRFTVSADVPVSAMEGAETADTTETDAVKFNMEVTMDSFNEPVEVAAPAESVSVMELLAPLIGGMMGGAEFDQ